MDAVTEYIHQELGQIIANHYRHADIAPIKTCSICVYGVAHGLYKEKS